MQLRSLLSSKYSKRELKKFEKFLPVIYESKTTRYLAKYTFPDNPNITFSENRWYIVFPHFNNVRQTKGYPNEQMSTLLHNVHKVYNKVYNVH